MQGVLAPDPLAVDEGAVARIQVADTPARLIALQDRRCPDLQVRAHPQPPLRDRSRPPGPAQALTKRLAKPHRGQGEPCPPRGSCRTPSGPHASGRKPTTGG